MASSAVLNELIWHFAGYMRLPLGDNFTVKVMYDGRGETPGVGDPESTPTPSHAPPGVDTLPDVHTYLAMTPQAEPPHFPHIPLPHIHDPALHNPFAPLALHHDFPLLPGPIPGGGGGGGGGGVGNFEITVDYASGGYQALIDVRQINLMISDNQVNAPADVVAVNNQHAAEMLKHMLDKAHDAVPTSLDLASGQTTGDTTHDLVAFMDGRDSHPLDTLAADAPYATQLGQFVNGVPVTDGSDPHQVTNDLFNTATDAIQQSFAGPPPAPTGDHHADSIQTVSVGSNIQANDAAISNFSGLSTSLAVFGNYCQTTAIVQTNVFAGHDVTAGDTGTTTFDPNTIQNIADVQNNVPTLTFTSDGSGTTASGLHWSVDVCNGNFYDVHSLVQYNYLENNNVVYQTSYTGESQIIAGGNSQTNFAQFQNLTADYQLIVVEGNYNQANLIFQTNVLLDNNLVNFNSLGLSSQSASGGGDSVVNDATIVDSANHNYMQFSSDAMSVLQALESQSGTIDPAALSNAFPSLFGNINVLVVTGSFYDINYISQTNVMSNSNVVQLNGSATAPAGATQSVSTGHDITVNSATIVDGGSALSPYLQGNYYNDMILIQTNIIGNDPKIAVQDPSQLAPEVVAFTGALDAPHPVSDAVSIVAQATTQQQHDGVAAVMH